jgi:hypothetical protein
VPLWDSLEAQCKSLELGSALAQIARLKDYPSSNINIVEYRQELKDLRRRIEDELKTRMFLFVPVGKAGFYSEKALFGTEVEARFPDAIFDIEEAGKCLALARATATVCHLMRVVEVGVRELAKTLSATIGTDRPWGAILNDVDDAIEALRKAGNPVDDLVAVSASLHAVKTAWRNPAMHSKAKYTEEEAEDIFLASRGFTRRLAKVV